MKVSKLFIKATMVLSLFAFCGQNLIAGNEGKVKVLKEIKEHTGNVHFAWYSPDGKLICSADEDSTLKVWDANTGKCLKTFKGERELYSASWSSDGKTIAIADKSVKLWNIETENVTILNSLSKADTVIFPVPDLLCYGDFARLNTPGTVGDPNWQWKMKDYTEFKAKMAWTKEMIQKSNR